MSAPTKSCITVHSSPAEWNVDHCYLCVALSFIIPAPSKPVVSIVLGIPAITRGVSNGLSDKYAPSQKGRTAKSWRDSVFMASQSWKAVTRQEKQSLVLSYPMMPSLLWGNAFTHWVKARNTAERVSYCISVSLSNLDICCSLTTVTVLIISYHNDIQFVPQAEKAELVAQAKNIMQSPDGSGSSGAEASSTRKRRQPATTPSRLSIVSQESA